MAIVEALYQAFGDLNVSSAAEGELTVSRQSMLILLAFSAIARAVLGGVGYDDLSVFFGLFVLLVLLRPSSGQDPAVQNASNWIWNA